jgi:hypothetical protein
MVVVLVVGTTAGMGAVGTAAVIGTTAGMVVALDIAVGGIPITTD